MCDNTIINTKHCTLYLKVHIRGEMCVEVMEASAESQLNDSVEGIIRDGKAENQGVCTFHVFVLSLWKKRTIHR